uniref:Uncharacterized protein n=1 Tax=viral metagenome TaxID=1070528 RepID=A0A6C0E5W9_9ZZZZ
MSKTCNDKINPYGNGYNYHPLFNMLLSHEQMLADFERHNSVQRMKLGVSRKKHEIMIHGSSDALYFNASHTKTFIHT